MKNTNPPEQLSPDSQSFNYKLDFLKLEFSSINDTIKRIDEITQAIKNWAVLIWAGGISLAIGQPDYRQFTLLTAVPPLLFWLLDARWRSTQQRFIFRLKKIRDFLNSPDCLTSFTKSGFEEFLVLDPFGEYYRNLPDFKLRISLRRTLKFRTVFSFYVGLIVISVALSIFFLLQPTSKPTGPIQLEFECRATGDSPQILTCVPVLTPK